MFLNDCPFWTDTVSPKANTYFDGFISALALAGFDGASNCLVYIWHWFVGLSGLRFLADR